MPEIDKDLYQLLSLGLLLIAVLVLLALLTALSRVNKLLRQQLTELKGGSTDQTPEVATSATEPVGEEDFPALASDSEFQDETGLVESSSDEAAGEPAHDEFAASSEPASTSSEPGLVGGGLLVGDSEGFSDTSMPEPETARTSAEQAMDPFTGESAGITSTPEEESDPFGAQPVGAADAVDEEHPFETGAADSGTIASEEEEQPFEKDGRWYFKRDEELLVYDEGTGDWVAAESTEVGTVSDSPAWGTSGVSDGAGSDVAGESTAATEQSDAIESADAGSDVAQEPAAAGGFWKCPSCGAVNGSTASTCRMCFAARP
ncbi:MAG TPA: Ran-binding zinc finger domain-containing protein [Actinomycetota bacterium]|nr:Ran-binding zinc finger domain-containing protein [Actinomycetota bacterium]